ncbi:MAG: CPBP family intramembrane metalloprotease [Planctomycetes bacterium]|nr:CPBP family intramembrane metalloprotease [Planctomycetota bacterium]
MEHELRQPPWSWQMAVLAFAMLFPTLGTWLWFVLLSGHKLMQAAFGVCKVLQFALPVIWVVAAERERIRLAKPNGRGIGMGLAFGLLVLATMLALYYSYLKTSPVLAGAPAEIDEKLTGLRVRSSLQFLALAAFYSFLHSLLEEYYWRCFVFGRLSRISPVGLAIGLSSAAFMAHHVVVIGQYFKGFGATTWFFSFCVGIGGAVWAWLYQRTRTLYGPWLSHMLVDAGLMWIGYDLWRMTS